MCKDTNRKLHPVPIEIVKHRSWNFLTHTNALMSGAIEITGDASIWTLGYISYSNPLLPALLKDPYTHEGSYNSLFKADSENEERWNYVRWAWS